MVRFSRKLACSLKWGAFALGLLAGGNAAQAQQTWMAYAYDSSTGAWGLGWGKADRDSAMNQALSNCVRPGCEVLGARMVRCIAVAHSRNPRSIGFGSGPDAATAEGNAYQWCEKQAPDNTCNPTAVRCGP